MSKVRLRFFDQVGHEIMYASSGNEHFSLNLVIVRLTWIMNRADKNWAQFSKIKYLENQNFQKKIYIKNWSSSLIFFRVIFFGKIRPIFDIEKCFWKYKVWDVLVQGGCS
jgi:hypothetical protein